MFTMEETLTPYQLINGYNSFRNNSTSFFFFSSDEYKKGVVLESRNVKSNIYYLNICQS